MKKKVILSLITLLPLALTACGNTKHEDAIYKINCITPVDQISAEPIAITATEFLTKLDQKESFPVLFHLPNCHACETTLEVLKTYVEAKKTMFFTVEVDTPTYDILNEALPEMFNADTLYPNMHIFSQGELTYTFNADNLSLYKSFNSEANKMFIDSNMYIGFDKKSVDNFVTEIKMCCVVTFDSRIPESLNFVTTYIYEKAEKCKYSTLFLDKALLKENFLEYDVPYETHAGMLHMDRVNEILDVRGTKIKNACNFLDKPEKAQEIISSYYRN